LKDCSVLTASSMAVGSTSLMSCSKSAVKVKDGSVISVDPTPRFAISPNFYMQFMEPLGITDGSVEAAWDYNSDDWRADLVELVKDLAPDTIRWGGAFIRYYKWREGVGPVEKRPSMYNYVWGGKETNRVGTAEFVDFCRKVGAEPLMCVNLLSDGVKAYWKTIHGENRSGDAEEAADWVSYANDPDNKERRVYFKDDSFITGFEYQKQPEMAWEKLLELSHIAEFRIRAMKEILDSINSDVGIAITEGHLSLQPYNANQVLTEWLSAVYHARTMNTYLRHGDRVKICTGADFCGTRWTVTAVMMTVPRGKSFLLPIGSIMRLFKKNIGKSGVSIGSCPAGLDIAGSRTENKIFLHVLNMNYSDPVKASFSVDGATITGGKVHEIAPESPRAYVNQNRPDVFDPAVKNFKPGEPMEWTFPATSVSVVELDISV